MVTDCSRYTTKDANGRRRVVKEADNGCVVGVGTLDSRQSHVTGETKRNEVVVSGVPSKLVRSEIRMFKSGRYRCHLKSPMKRSISRTHAHTHARYCAAFRV
jgi:hypothetical protein